MVQMDRCKLTLDLPKFQPMKEQDSHLLTNQRPSLTLDLPKVVIAPPSDNGLVLRRQYSVVTHFEKPLTKSCLNLTILLTSDLIMSDLETNAESFSAGKHGYKIENPLRHNDENC